MRCSAAILHEQILHSNLHEKQSRSKGKAIEASGIYSVGYLKCSAPLTVVSGRFHLAESFSFTTGGQRRAEAIFRSYQTLTRAPFQ